MTAEAPGANELGGRQPSESRRASPNGAALNQPDGMSARALVMVVAAATLSAALAFIVNS
jgi:hypothetical protein